MDFHPICAKMTQKKDTQWGFMAKSHFICLQGRKCWITILKARITKDIKIPRKWDKGEPQNQSIWNQSGSLVMHCQVWEQQLLKTNGLSWGKLFNFSKIFNITRTCSIIGKDGD